MKTRFQLVFFALVMSFAAGCALVKPFLKHGEEQPLDNASKAADGATQKADTAAGVVDTKRDERDSKVLANVTSARTANRGNADSPAKVQVDGELSIAERRLADTKPDPEELAAAAERRELVEKGKASEAREAYEKAAKKADDAVAEIAAAKREAEVARQERDRARQAELVAQQETLRQAEQNRIDAEKLRSNLEAKFQLELAAERKKASDVAMAKQVRDLNLAGAGCLLAFGLFVGFGGLAGLSKGWPFGVLALVCFGLAQIVAQWWFKWGVLGAVVIALGAVAWWVWRHMKDHTLRQAAEAKAAQFKTALGDIVPALDGAYENAESSVRELLDKEVFSRLSAAMDKATKQTIHEVRSNTGAATTTP